MILFILCHFSLCIILHATKVACEHRYGVVAVGSYFPLASISVPQGLATHIF